MRLLAILALAVMLSSCSWQEWRASVTITGVSSALRSAVSQLGGAPDRAGYATGVVTGKREIALDYDCTDDNICVQQLGDPEYSEAHELGHLVYDEVGNPWGVSLIAQEQGANCVATLVTRRPASGNFNQPDQGYWVCPQSFLDRMRNLMVAHGIINEDEFR